MCSSGQAACWWGAGFTIKAKRLYPANAALVPVASLRMMPNSRRHDLMPEMCEATVVPALMVPGCSAK